MSRGNIIESGHKSHHFKIHDYIEPVAPSPLVPLEEETEEEVVEEVIVPKVAVPLGAEDEEGESVVEGKLNSEVGSNYNELFLVNFSCSEIYQFASSLKYSHIPLYAQTLMNHERIF